MEKKEKVEDLLNTLRIPAFPPNKSQWKKLEIAVKFINTSKNSARQRKESLKLEPKAPEVLAQSSLKLSKKIANVENEEVAETEHENFDQKTEPSDKKAKRKDSKWSKIRSSLHQIM